MSSPYSAGTDQLVCHRVKECCVHLHSCIQSWKELSTTSFDVASKLVNSSLESRYGGHNLLSMLSCDLTCMQVYSR